MKISEKSLNFDTGFIRIYPASMLSPPAILRQRDNKLKSEQNGQHLTDDIFKYILLANIIVF